MLTVLKTRFNEVKEKMSTLVHLELIGHDKSVKGRIWDCLIRNQVTLTAGLGRITL